MFKKQHEYYSMTLKTEKKPSILHQTDQINNDKINILSVIELREQDQRH